MIHAPVTGPTPHVLARLCPGGWREPQKPWSRRSSREKTEPPPGAGSCINSTQTDPRAGKCKIPRETGKELEENSRRRSSKTKKGESSRQECHPVIDGSSAPSIHPPIHHHINPQKVHLWPGRLPTLSAAKMLPSYTAKVLHEVVLAKLSTHIQ